MEKKVPILEETMTPGIINSIPVDTEDFIKTMASYVDSKQVVDQCHGCNKVFDFVHTEENEDGEPIQTELRCVAYCNPAAKWPAKDQKFATAMFKVREVDSKGKAEMVERELPILEKYCPLASHYTVQTRIKTDTKVHVGQGKGKQGGNR